MNPRFYLTKLLAATVFASLLCLNVNAQVNSELSGGRLQLQRATETIDAPMLTTDVVMDINGLTARIKVTQKFENNSAEWVEGKYYFPLPEKSAVDHLLMKIGDRVIKGEIHEKLAAQKIYQQAKISGKKASLVEQHRPNVFSNSVANIGPHETIEISIEYQQDLIYQKDTGLSIRFPMTMTPRYTPKAMLIESYDALTAGFQTQPDNYALQIIPQTSEQEEANRVSMLVNLNSGFALNGVSSSSHRILVTQRSESDYQIAFELGTEIADSDFILNWKPLAGAEPRVALFSESRQGEQYVSLMVMPPAQSAELSVLPREVIFVLDTSGSMAGESIKQAKQALIYGLDTLVKGDQFNIIEFNTNTSQLFSNAQIYNEHSRQNAINFVSRLDANGGTEMMKAMDVALDGINNNRFLRQVIFLTDGSINNEAQLFQKIEKDLGDSRLFTVGIGSAPNEFFMKRAAQYGRGSSTFIADINQTESQIRRLFNQISSPVLSHVVVQWPKDAEVEMWPQKIPDLFSGEPLWIKAKLKLNAIDSSVQINGRLSNNLWQTTIPLNRSQNQVGISQLWAREKIAAVLNDAKHGQVNPTQQKIITDTALQHHLVSRFTSLVAVDHTPARIGQPLIEKNVSQVKPKGSTTAGISYPRTANELSVGTFWSLLSVLFGLFGWFTLLKRN